MRVCELPAVAVFRWMVACPRGRGLRPGNVMHLLRSQCHSRGWAVGLWSFLGALHGEEGKQWAFRSCVELGACLGMGSPSWDCGF